MKVLISAELAQKIVDYLKHRPYEEVFELIHGILQAPRGTAQEAKEAENDG